MLTIIVVFLEAFVNYRPGEIYNGTFILDLVLLAIFATWLLS